MYFISCCHANKEIPFQGGTSFVDHLCYLYLEFFIAAMWSSAGKRADLLELVCDDKL